MAIDHTEAQARKSTSTTATPRFGEALRFWLKLGFISFGGPSGQIAVMHTELVEKKRWIANDRFLHALNYCMLLPGPEAQQLATYCGWLLHRTWGGIAAGTLFVLPSIFILWGLSCVYVTYGSVPWVGAAFHGLKPAVMAIVAAATLRIGRKALKNGVMWGLASIAFIAIFVFSAPFPTIIAGAALFGWVGYRWRPEFFTASDSGKESIGNEPETANSAIHTKPSWKRASRILAFGLLLWWTPVAAAGWLQGWDQTLFHEGLFFSKAAMVTLGGAYAVLPYVAQQAVETHAWLTAPQMLDGLAFAETTPGPLIMVVQHVGFMGGWTQPGGLNPLTSATLGALLTTWVTFVPCFLWIFLGAPHVEQLRGHARIDAALSAVTAAVVGVILNLAVWFGWHVVYPKGGEIDWFATAIGVAAFVAILRFKIELAAIVLAGGIAGVVHHFLQ